MKVNTYYHFLNKICLLSLLMLTAAYSQIVINHECTDLSRIPSFWINQVKQQNLLFNVVGESHARAYMYGLELVQADDPTYALDESWYSTPDTSVDMLRIWYTSGGEAYFWTNEPARLARNAHLTSRDNAGDPLTVFGFGWCWDMSSGTVSPGIDPVYGCHWYGWSEGSPEGSIGWGIDAEDYPQTLNSVHLYTYIDAVVRYNNHLPVTNTIFTTGPVDGQHGNERGYQRYLKHEAIREYVNTHGGILFDYADILCWQYDTQTYYMDSWNGHVFQNGNTTLATGGTGYDGGQGGSHISEEACRLLGKAIWWMMARIAGWDGTGPVSLSVKIFMESPYNAGSMETNLQNNGLLPLQSPYDDTEVSAFPDNVVDWVQVELRTVADGSGENYKKSVFLKNDGMIVDLDGSENLTITAPEGEYYIVVRHRNHMTVMSAGAVHLYEQSP